jgi:hypothetical protein
MKKCKRIKSIQLNRLLQTNKILESVKIINYLLHIFKFAVLLQFKQN